MTTTGQNNMEHYHAVSMYYQSLDSEKVRICSERQARYLEKAKQQAFKSSMAHRHGCVIVHDDTILASGFNYIHKHLCHKYSIHSEVEAISKIKKRLRPLLPSCEMYVVRIAPKSMDNCLKYSKPCKDCTTLIEKVGIGKVYYSSNYEFEDKISKTSNKNQV